MDCLPLGMHAFLVPLIFCVLHHVTCQPYMPQQVVYDYPMGFPEIQPRFLQLGMYQPFTSYQQRRNNYFDDWNRRDTGYRRKQLAPVQYDTTVQRRRPRPRLEDVQPRREIIRPRPRRPVVSSHQQPRYQTRSRYTPVVNARRTQTPKVVTRSPIPQRNRTLRQKPTIVTGILTNVMPHPKQRMYHGMSAKKRARFRAVAKAKSFPGIIKNTALENKITP